LLSANGVNLAVSVIVGAVFVKKSHLKNSILYFNVVNPLS
jgi:hypothetical protein